MNLGIKSKKEMTGIQNASIFKRLSAALLDIILVAIIATGVMFGISAITNYDQYTEELESYYKEYETKYGFSLDMSEDDYNKMSEEEKKEFQEAYNDFFQKEKVLYLYNMTTNLILVMVTLGALFGILIVEFIIPLILKDGQTIGMKCFGICLVKNNCVKVNGIVLFVRSILGMFAVETMIPLYIMILIIFSSANIFMLILLVGIILLNIIVFLFTSNKCLLHDVFAYTVVVDKSLQVIFESEEELIQYKKEVHANKVQKNTNY